MRVLITGGAGFIGSHLTDRLLHDGHTVTVIDDLSTGRLFNLHAARRDPELDLQFVRLDITSDALERAVAKARPEVALHLAAQVDVRRSVADPVRDAMVNVVGTVNLLESCRRHGTGKVVLTTSGGCIYGEPAVGDLPVDERFPGHPHSPYGASKRGVEEYLHSYRALYGLRWSALALGNVYGPRQDPAGEAGVVSIFGGRMLDGDPVTIYGDGTQTRDFVYVDDVVDAFVRAIDRGDGERMNIGTGEQVSINELFRELAAQTGYTRTAQYADARPGELQHIALDATLAARRLDWEPRQTLAGGLGRTLEWLRG